MDSYTELKTTLCRIVNLDPNASDKALIAAVERCADTAKKGEADSARRAAAEAREAEIKKILTQAGGALRREQAEQILRDRAAAKSSQKQ